MDSTQVLVVDEDSLYRRMIGSCLAMDGLRVMEAATAAQARGWLRSETFALIVLDIDFGSDEGRALAREISGASDAAILVVSAKSDREVRYEALREFADDYIVKPIDVHELMARSRALLRRAIARAVRQPLPSGTEARQERANGGLSFHGFTIDRGGHQLIDPHGQSVQLTATEFKLLEVFIANENRVLTRERLLELSGGAKGNGLDAFDRAIDMRVRRLRRKLGRQSGAHPDIIRTVRGVGYMLAREER